MWYDQTVAEPRDQPQDIEELLKELALKIERCKQLYEQYFMGIEKLEPLTARKEITRALLTLQQQHIRNTGLRFKFGTMLQKWNIYITYWNRILREIENGTYVRHLVKVKRAADRDGKEVPDELKMKRPPPATIDTRGAAPLKHFLDQDSEAHTVAATPAAQRPRDEGTDPGFERVPAKKPLPVVPGMAEADLRALHRKYVETRQRTGEGANVSYETLVNSLSKQVGRVLEQPGVKSVRFDVDVKEGKTVLKAIPLKATPSRPPPLPPPLPKKS